MRQTRRWHRWLLALAAIGGSSLALPVGGQQDDAPLTITEVLPNAAQGVADAAYEWIELHNRSDAPVSLEGWAIEDNTAADALPAVAIPPGGYALVVAAPDLVRVLGVLENAPAPGAATVVAVVADGRLGNGLANSGDRVLLRDPDGTVVAWLSWGTDRSVGDLPAPPVGTSLARADDSFRTAAPTPGGPAQPAPTPSGPPAALRITEIFADAGRGARDAAFEWVELLNDGPSAVDLAGWRIADGAGSDPLPALTLAPGERSVIAGSPAAVPDAPGLLIILEDGRIGNGLANSGDVVSLFDPADRLVDRVDYRSAAIPQAETGRSIALLDGAWTISVTPSPGAPDVDPLVPGAVRRTASTPTSTPTAVPAERVDGDGGIPGWALIAVAVGAPILTLGSRSAWSAVRRRRAPSRG